MKVLSTLLITLSLSNAMTTTTLKIPLFVEQKNKIVPMTEINKKLNLKGENKIQEYFIVNDTQESIQKAHDAYWEIFGTLQEKYPDLELASDLPGGNYANGVGTCYTGNPAEAIDIAGGLTDSIYSDQLGFWGWKYKKEVHLNDNADDETLKALNERSDAWRNFKGNDESILVVTYESDDGDDMNVGTITKCK